MRTERPTGAWRLYAGVLAFVGMLMGGGLAPAHAQAVAGSDADEASLARGAVADVTPQQRYQSAIREAGGGLKLSLAECRALAAEARKPCEAQARQRYQDDMARARAMLTDPSISPINETGGPIRSKVEETITITRP